MEELGEFTLENIEDCTYGIYVTDPASNNGETTDMVHWVAYWHEPGVAEVTDLKRELSEDDQFGLVDVAHRLQFFKCTGDELRELLGKYPPILVTPKLKE